MVRKPWAPCSKVKVQMTGSVGVLLRSLDRLHRLGDGGHRLNAEGIRAALGQRDHLLFEGVIEILFRHIAAFVLDNLAGGADRRGDIAFVAHGFFRQPRGGDVEFLNLIRQPEFALLVPGAAEGIGLHDVGAGGDIGLGNALHRSGWETHQASGDSPGCRPFACKKVPIAPSEIRISPRGNTFEKGFHMYASKIF